MQIQFGQASNTKNKKNENEKNLEIKTQKHAYKSRAWQVQQPQKKGSPRPKVKPLSAARQKLCKCGCNGPRSSLHPCASCFCCCLWPMWGGAKLNMHTNSPCPTSLLHHPSVPSAGQQLSLRLSAQSVASSFELFRQIAFTLNFAALLPAPSACCVPFALHNFLVLWQALRPPKSMQMPLFIQVYQYFQ